MLEIKLLPTSEVEISGEIPSGDFMSGRSRALKELADNIEIDGFRKGKAPENILLQKVGMDALLEKMAVIALEKEYVKIIESQKIKAIGRPEITITKMAENNPLGYKIKTAVLPDITLPDYKSIAAKTIKETNKEIIVEDKEMEDIIERLRKSRASKNDKREEILPELNDDFAKTLGKFENLEALKKTIKENLLAEKKVKEKERMRMEILEKITEKVEEVMPKLLVEAEKGKMMEEMKMNILQMGLKWEDYLAHIKKTEEELRKDWEKDAEKRVKHGLILEEIAAKEKLEATPEELEKETKAITEYYKGLGKEIDPQRTRDYLVGVIKNEKVFKILESQ